jgi:hypothetical protein
MVAVVSGLLIVSHLIAQGQAGAQDGPRGTVPVTVYNTSANPIPIAGTVVVRNQPTSTPFQASRACVVVQVSVQCDLYTVPAGKRAVIEYFSFSHGARGADVPGFDMRPALFTTVSGTTIRSFIQPLVVMGPSEGGTGQVVRLYADPGTTVVARVIAGSVAGFDALFSISGVLVDVP